MKSKLTLLTLATLVILSSAISDDKDRLDRLAKLEESYQSELERVIKPVKTRYQDSLEKLQKEFTQSGDLEAALAVRGKLAIKDLKALTFRMVRFPVISLMSHCGGLQMGNGLFCIRAAPQPQAGAVKISGGKRHLIR
jgi:hypothetical protein